MVALDAATFSLTPAVAARGTYKELLEGTSSAELSAEWVGLSVRGGAKAARLAVRGLDVVRAFATITDLHTGQERPVAFGVPVAPHRLADRDRHSEPCKMSSR